ncbi:helix-turn-helix transcriptional regulator [Thalassomonas actiniarum]|uniref:Helix-turn-helix transcriptional regulator n=1 Tax=Thalassomonas actiniarum TaxID=485447 RepID=A0AAE9YQ47_9GAMM|nr:helix-turn-helix transcriptional regulator [Thalassomonas actiniarum]WDD98219.1 helix-turn-helix transcriptional regulator [Thalassomonas actiniarum]
MFKFVMGDDLRRIRLNADRTMEEVADKLGVSRVTIGKWENGIGRPDVNQFLELYGFCGRNIKLIYEEIFSIRDEFQIRDEDDKTKRASKRKKGKKRAKSGDKQKQ